MQELEKIEIHLSHRQSRIIEYAKRDGFVSVEIMASDFNVTPQTIRRDLNFLCDNLLLNRHHGGATLPANIENKSYDARRSMNHDSKLMIAQKIVGFIPDGSSLFMNIGTTTEEVAKRLLGHKRLRIITNNLNVANIMSANNEFEIIIAGGYIRNRDCGIIGEATIDFINQFRVDYAIIGISGIDDDGTLLDYDYREVRVAQAIIKNAREVLLVADHSKFKQRPIVRLCPAKDIDHIFTDKILNIEIAEILKAADVKIHIAAYV